MKINVIWELPVTASLFRAPKTFRTMDRRSRTNKYLRKCLVIIHCFVPFQLVLPYLSSRKRRNRLLLISCSCRVFSECSGTRPRSIGPVVETRRLPACFAIKAASSKFMQIYLNRNMAKIHELKTVRCTAIKPNPSILSSTPCYSTSLLLHSLYFSHHIPLPTHSFLHQICAGGNFS